MGYPPASIMVPCDAEPRFRYRYNAFQTHVLRTVFSSAKTVFGFDGANRLGKTGAVMAYLRAQLQNNPPGVTGGFFVPSIAWFRGIALPIINDMFRTRTGSEVAVRLSSPIQITWKATGSKVDVYSFEAFLRAEGATFGFAAMDESQMQGPEVLSLILSRLSDSRAKRPNVLITGIPTGLSWVEDSLNAMGEIAHYESGFGSHINEQNLIDGYIDRLEQGLSAEEIEFRVFGRRPQRQGAVFGELSLETYPRGNIIDAWEYDPMRFTIAMFDPGLRRSALILAQVMPDDTIVVFDELMSDDMSTEAVTHRFADIATHREQAEWSELHLGKGRFVFDKIAIDSAGATPDINTSVSCADVFRRKFPRADIEFNSSDRDRAMRTYRIKRVLCQGTDQRRRLLFTREFWERSIADRRENADAPRNRARGRSLALALTRLDYPRSSPTRAISDAYIDCPVDGHAADALGYGLLALEARGPKQGIRK